MHSNLELEVYPTFIFQLTTISLLLGLSAGVVTVVPSALPANLAVAQAEVKTEIIESGNYEPIADSKNIERFLADYFEDKPILAEIARCESRNRHLDKNGNVLRGGRNRYDVGVMQINEQYHLETAKKLGIDIHTLDGNVAYAKRIYQKQGAKPWMASSACWAKFKESEIAKK